MNRPPSPLNMLTAAISSRCSAVRRSRGRSRRAQQTERGRAGRDGVHDQPRHFRKIEILSSFRQRDPGIPHNVRALGGRLLPAPALRT